MFKIIASVSILILSVLMIFNLSGLSKFIGFKASDNEFIAGQFRYQALLLFLAFLTTAVLYVMNSEVMGKFLSIGNISAPVSPVPLFGIKEGESWLSLGLGLSFFITFMTAVFVYFQVREAGFDVRFLVSVIGWVLLFSLTNSLSEELIFRLGVIGALYEVVSPASLMIISSVIFGLAHYGGMPNGAVGMFMAGVLGWLLMKSVLETHGMFWAWGIHFLQDVVIFMGLVLLNARNDTSVTMPN